jgi:hypothetical protein
MSRPQLVLKQSTGWFAAGWQLEKLSNPAATGQPEDQLRAPFEQLLADFAELSHLPRSAVATVGESSVRHLKTRPDYAVSH